MKIQWVISRNFLLIVTRAPHVWAAITFQKLVLFWYKYSFSFLYLISCFEGSKWPWINLVDIIMIFYYNWNLKKTMMKLLRLIKYLGPALFLVGLAYTTFYPERRLLANSSSKEWVKKYTVFFSNSKQLYTKLSQFGPLPMSSRLSSRWSKLINNDLIMVQGLIPGSSNISSILFTSKK